MTHLSFRPDMVVASKQRPRPTASRPRERVIVGWRTGINYKFTGFPEFFRNFLKKYGNERVLRPLSDVPGLIVGLVSAARRRAATIPGVA